MASVKNINFLFIALVLAYISCQVKSTNNNKPIFSLTEKCLKCHPKYIDNKLSGFGDLQNLRGKTWTYRFIENPVKFAEVDSTAKAILLKWKPVVMVSFPELSNSQVDSIFQYYQTR